MCKEGVPNIPTTSHDELDSLTACCGVVPHGRYNLRANAPFVSVGQHPYRTVFS